MTNFTPIKLPSSYRPKTLDQQRVERAAQRAEERRAMLSQIPIAVQRAIETIAYWENVEKEGGYVDGSFGNQKDYRAYHEFMKQASQKQRKIVKRLEQEVKSKLS